MYGRGDVIVYPTINHTNGRVIRTVKNIEIVESTVRTNKTLFIVVVFSPSKNISLNAIESTLIKNIITLNSKNFLNIFNTSYYLIVIHYHNLFKYV